MIRKLLIGTLSLVALFAIAGSALFFAEPTSAQVAPGSGFGDRAGQFGGFENSFAQRGERNVVNNEQMLERIAEHLGMTVEELQAELDAGNTIPEIAEAQGVDLPKHRGRGGKDRPAFAKIDRRAVVADALGITVEELEAAHEAGTKLDELAEANGTTIDAVKEAMMAAAIDAINQAVADSDLTQEQADVLLAKIELQQLAQDIFSKEDGQEVVADALGITAAELEAAHDAGTKLKELAEANGTTMEAIKEAVKAAREAAIQAAIDDGTLTAEQGEQLLNGRGKFGGKHGHGRRGPGGRGGFGPDNLNTPIQGDA